MIRLSDVRYALRLWRRHPTLVVVAGLSLGLGVGATTTMYSVVNRVAHYELGFADVDRLVVVSNANAEKGIREQLPSWEIIHALFQHGQSFEAFGFFQGGGAPVTLSGTSETSRVSQMPVDANALSIVGVPPLLGRTYRMEDFDDVVKQKEARSIVVSYDTWQHRLGGSPDVVGTTVRVDGEPRTIIGVMPRNFALVPWEDNVAFWAANDLRRIPEARWMIAVGRLKPGVSRALQEPQPREIVGVVADVTYPSFFTETPAAVYVPFRQHLSQYGREDEWLHTRKVLAIRTSVDPLTLIRSVQDSIAHGTGTRRRTSS